MYICPVCYEEFKTEALIQRHFLSCWRSRHLGHKSKAAPRRIVETKEVNDNILDFFKELNHG